MRNEPTDYSRSAWLDAERQTSSHPRRSAPQQTSADSKELCLTLQPAVAQRLELRQPSAQPTLRATVLAEGRRRNLRGGAAGPGYNHPITITIFRPRTLLK